MPRKWEEMGDGKESGNARIREDLPRRKPGEYRGPGDLGTLRGL